MPFSTPLATVTIIWLLFKYFFANTVVSRTKIDGTAITTTSLSSTASSIEQEYKILLFISTPGKFLCLCVFMMVFTSSGKRDHNMTSCPLLANRLANAVPHVPAPNIPIRFIVIFLVTIIPYHSSVI